MNLRGACHHAARLRSPRIAFRIGNNASSGLDLRSMEEVGGLVRVLADQGKILPADLADRDGEPLHLSPR